MAEILGGGSGVKWDDKTRNEKPVHKINGKQIETP
jgi:hypothetical protein